MRISDWSSDVCSSDLYGGQGLPFILQLWLDEMISAANLSFGLFPGLTRGACEAVMAHASAELKDMWLPRLVSGEWTGEMALTESGAGTDLALLKNKTAHNAAGSYDVTGTKIFISSGDQYFVDTIVLLVLCRLPSSQEGGKGGTL